MTREPGRLTLIGQLAMCLLLPAAALSIAALGQVMLQRAVPSLAARAVAGMSLDSYLVLLLMAALTSLSGYLMRRAIPSRAGLVAGVIVPLAWSAWLFSSLQRAEAGLFNVAVLFVIATAVIPLLGVLCGWTLAERREGRCA